MLIVDDDMRNIFALATVLEEHGMDIVWADNGRDAISRVANDPQIKVVLMDIMMPEMDGMATMKEIRKLPAGKNLPMIAVTAKAMKGDREKCIEAGAWDYLSKPVNTQDLLTVLRAGCTSDSQSGGPQTPPLPEQEKVNILVVDDLPEKHVVFRTILDELGRTSSAPARARRRCATSSRRSSRSSCWT